MPGPDNKVKIRSLERRLQRLTARVDSLQLEQRRLHAHRAAVRLLTAQCSACLELRAALSAPAEHGASDASTTCPGGGAGGGGTLLYAADAALRRFTEQHAWEEPVSRPAAGAPHSAPRGSGPPPDDHPGPPPPLGWRPAEAAAALLNGGVATVSEYRRCIGSFVTLAGALLP